MSLSNNIIKKYTQLNDTLSNIKLDEYLNETRNKIHNELYNNAIDKLISEVYNDETTCKLAIAVQKKIYLYNYYQIKANTVNGYPDDITELTKKMINQLNKDDFQIIEIKNKYWYNPSQIIIIYNSVAKDSAGNPIKFTMGPYSLFELWDNDYILKRNINNILTGDNKAKYVIKHIDYIKGLCILYDKMNEKELTVDLDYISNINNFDFDKYYDELFSIKRKTGNN